VLDDYYFFDIKFDNKNGNGNLHVNSNDMVKMIIYGIFDLKSLKEICFFWTSICN
jgi:hypothetical protein